MNTKMIPLLIVAVTCASSVCLARNDPYTRGSGDRSTSGQTAPRTSSRSVSPAPAAPTQRATPSYTPAPTQRATPSFTPAPAQRATPSFTPAPAQRVAPSFTPAPAQRFTPSAGVGPSSFRSGGGERSAPAQSYNPTPAPVVRSAPSERSQGPSFDSVSSRRVTPAPAPVNTPSRVTSERNTSTFRATPPARDIPTRQTPVTIPSATPRELTPSRFVTPTENRTRPSTRTPAPTVVTPDNNARNPGTVRTLPARPETAVTRRAPDVQNTAPTVTGEPTRTTPSHFRTDGPSRTEYPARTSRIRTDSPTVTDSPTRTSPSRIRTDAPTVTDTPTRTYPSRSHTATPIDARRNDPMTSSGRTSNLRMSDRDSLSTHNSLSLRSTRGDSDSDRFDRTAVTRAIPGTSLGNSHVRLPSSARDREGFRRDDGRTSLYRPPYGAHDRNHQPGFDPRRASYNPPRYYSGHGHGSSHHDSRDWRNRHACSPVWWGPVVYPAGFGLTWHSGSFALSIATYAPVRTYTRYYDSWSCGGWGYTGVYYGGWRSGWYGGFSYVYNPWPVYRTYYLYDPEPLVTRTETVYVTQPAETVYVTQPAETVTPAANPSALPYSSPAPEQDAEPAAWEDAPAVPRAETEVTACLCPCQCNGERPCICSYPCGAEYAFSDQEFSLGATYTPYAEALNPESIWSSYAGLDRWDAGSSTDLPESAADYYVDNPQ